MSLNTSFLRILWPLLGLLMLRPSTYALAFVNASQGPEALTTRNYFYVGGGYVDVSFHLHSPFQ